MAGAPYSILFYFYFTNSALGTALAFITLSIAPKTKLLLKNHGDKA
jgi:hypothetical protein